MKGHIQNCLMNYTAIYNFATMISLCRHLYCIGEKRSLTMKHHNSNVFDHLLPNPNLQHKKTVGLVLIPLSVDGMIPSIANGFCSYYGYMSCFDPSLYLLCPVPGLLSKHGHLFCGQKLAVEQNPPCTC